MKLIFFLTVITIFSISFGEFGHFPFGGSSSSVSLIDIFLSITLGLLLIWKIGIKKVFEVPTFFKILSMFWLIGFISLLFSRDFSGSYYLIRFIIYSSASFLGYSLVCDDSKNFKNIISAIIILGCILSFLGLVQLLLYPDIAFLTAFGFDPHQNRLVSTFLDPNLLGAFLIIPLLWSFERFELNRVKYGVISGILLASIILTFSRTGLLMLVLGVLIYGLNKSKKIVVFLMLGLVLFYLISGPFQMRVNGAFKVDKSAAERFESWNKGLSIFESSPIVGIGFNNLRQVLNRGEQLKVFSENGGHSGAGIDSSFLFVLATTGILGLLAYLTYWIYSIFKLMSKFGGSSKNIVLINLITILVLFVGSQFINSLFFPPIMLLMYLVMGTSFGYLKINK